jgi:hypothetical protein
MKYFIIIDEERKGPYSIEELKHFDLSKDTLVWRNDFDDWIEAYKVEELKELISQTPPPIPNKVKSPVSNINLNLGFQRPKASGLKLTLEKGKVLFSKELILNLKYAFRSALASIVFVLIAGLIYFLFLSFKLDKAEKLVEAEKLAYNNLLNFCNNYTYSQFALDNNLDSTIIINQRKIYFLKKTNLRLEICKSNPYYYSSDFKDLSLTDQEDYEIGYYDSGKPHINLLDGIVWPKVDMVEDKSYIQYYNYLKHRKQLYEDARDYSYNVNRAISEHESIMEDKEIFKNYPGIVRLTMALFIFFSIASISIRYGYFIVKWILAASKQNMG